MSGIINKEKADMVRNIGEKEMLGAGRTLAMNKVYSKRGEE